VAVLAFLVVGLLYFRWGLKAPLYAAGLAVVLSFFSRETLMTPKRIVDSLVTIGSMITQTAAIIIPTGFVISALTMTGTAAALISPLHQFGADNVFVVLLIAMAVCYVFGLIGMSLIAYIVLAVTMAPALVRISGMDILSLHLFLAYFALLGGLTPPVALLAFVAASVADAPPMKTAWTAMRLAVVIYFIPFFFVMNPSLLLRGDPVESVYLFVLCLIGITFIAGGLEGYLIRIGKLNPWQRIVFAVGGFLIAYPAVEVNLLSEWYTTIAGFLMVLPMASIMFRQRRQPKPESLSGITPTI